MAPREDDPGGDAPRARADGQRVVLRPIANPFVVGLLALAVASLLVSSLQLAWVPADQANGIGLALVAFVAPLQLAAAWAALLARDHAVVAALAVQGGTHLVVGVDLLTGGGVSTGQALALFLVLAGTVLLVPAVVSFLGKVVPAVLAALVAVRFVLDGLARFAGPEAWTEAAGGMGIAVFVVALYAALAFELEDASGRVLLPLGRRGQGRQAVQGQLPDSGRLAEEPGVRNQL